MSALCDWEAEVAKYEQEEMRTIDMDDKMGVLLEVAPTSIRQHLQQHLSSLGTYDLMRRQIESYLGSKKTWQMEGRVGKAFGSANAPKEKSQPYNPNAMQLDAFSSKGGKGKGDGKGNKGDGQGQ